MLQTVARAARSKAFRPRRAMMSHDTLYRAPVMERIRLITDGVLATDAKQWLEIATLGRNTTLKALDLPVATFNKKVKARARLSPAESERVIGFARLVGQIEALL